MTAVTKIALVEAKLFLRERVAAIAVLGFPVALVAGFGAIPDFGKPDSHLGGQSGTEYIASIGIAIMLAALSLNGIPMVLAGYREKGILRRLGTTPAGPLSQLVAGLMVWSAIAVMSATLVLAVARLAYHVPLPDRFGWFVLAFFLGMAALFAVGMVVAASVRNGRTAAGIGWFIMMPSFFLAGVWVPREELSPVLRHIGDYTPLAAALQAVRDSWVGRDPRPLNLGIMAAYAVAATLLATRVFRWE